MTAVTVWVVVLFNFFHVWQGTLPDHYTTENDCKLAIVEKGYATFNPIGVHGECMSISGTYTK